MKYISHLEIIAQLARYIWELGFTHGLGNEDDTKSWHSVICCDVNKDITESQFKFIYEDLEKKGFIKTVLIGNIPYLDKKTKIPITTESGDYIDSEENFYNFIIKNLDGLKKYLDELEKEYPKRKQPLIRTKALELIARKIGELDSGEKLKNFLKECLVNKKLIVYSNTKWKMIYDVFEYLALSDKKEDNDLLFRLIEEISHPLMYGGDKGKAIEIQDYFTNCLEYDGYCVSKGKLVKVTDEILDEIKKRKAENEAVQNLAFSKLANCNILGSPFGMKQQQVRAQFDEKTIIEKQTPISVIIHNTNQLQYTELQQKNQQKEDGGDSVEKTLSGCSVEFNDNEAIIKIEGLGVSLPPYKNEHFFCRAMFEHQVNEPIDWSVIYERITGYYSQYYGKPPSTKKEWHMVYDTMEALNKRVEECFGTRDHLFSWAEKTVKRNF